MVENPKYPNPLRRFREAAGMSQPELAKLADTNVQNVSRIERGERELSRKWADIFSAHLGVSSQDLMFADQRGPAASKDTRDAATSRVAQKPGRASAAGRVPDLAIHAGMGGGGLVEVHVNGNGVPTDPDQVRGYWEFPEYILRRLGNLKNIHAWEVRGDSMEPTLQGGSVVFVDIGQTTPPPDDIYAINYGDGLMVKRVKLIPRSDRYSIISDNSRYGADDLGRDEVHIWGRVVGWFQWRG